MVDSFDYIVVGAGSSGCVVANRLSEDSGNKVLVLEAGGEDWNPWIHIPVGYFKTMHNPSVDWCYKTEPDEGISGRQLQWPRGKVLGGSSSLNGLLYIRGQKEDYDRWADLGNTGWAYNDVLPYFRKSEDQERGESEYHGINGPLKVSDLRLKRPIADKFVRAAIETGIPLNADCNGAEQEGVGYFQQTTFKGLRWSTAKGFLKPARKRNNLTLITKAQVIGLKFDKKKVVGLTYKRGNETFSVNVNKEIVLSSGAINSPQLLQLSGIGDQELLGKLGIPVLQNLPGVGKNLQDHLQVRMVYKTRDRTLNDEVGNPLRKMMVGIQYFLTRTGPLTLAASQVYAFTRSNPELDRPDIQFHMQPLSADKPGEGTHKFSAFTASVCQLRPWSRGEIEIQSTNPLDYPKIYPNYLSDPRDRTVAVNGIKVARAIANAPALRDAITSEFVPGSHYQTDDELLEAARDHSQTIYHPAGTCKMGVESDAVVDPRLRVRGIQGLRIADASIMPEIISGNTNAPCIMIGEKAADMILEDNR